MTQTIEIDGDDLPEYYVTIDVEKLFGHIDDPQRREAKLREYAEELRDAIEDLDPDDFPILPEEVNIHEIGPASLPDDIDIEVTE